MASATHLFKGSCSTFPSVPSSWSRGSKLKHFAPTFHSVGRKDRFISLKCRSCTSIGASRVHGSKSNSFKISAFKGGNSYNDSGIRTNSSKDNGKVGYLENTIEASSLESSKVQNVTPSIAADETISRSLAIHNLFKSWLMLLRTPLQSQHVDEVLEESSSVETSEIPNSLKKQERSDFLKAVWCYFVGLNATIKIPLLLFTPLYLGVYVAYGSKVSKELTPLWILGPLFVALYIKMFRAICKIYGFSFKQTAKLVKNLPVYYLVVHDHIVNGKLNEATRRHVFEPLAVIKNTDYKEMTKNRMKDLQGWFVERYLDFVESIWPYYCRTIRFLKRANLI
ncbi:hypothetical protein ABFX02_04G171100 [Erythranthe guttata]